MKILIVSDTGKPQINGVVRTLDSLSNELRRMGHDIRIISPDSARPFVFPVPFYRNIKLEFLARPRLARAFRDFAPDFVHIATEGPLGFEARRLCLNQKRRFTTSYHTSFPDYLATRAPRILTPLITRIAYAFLKRFHAPAAVVMVPTSSTEKELRARGFKNLVRWSGGVDLERFILRAPDDQIYKNLPRPILLYVGRVAVEKNLPAFLDLKSPGTKIVVGGGPDLQHLQKQHPEAHFLGELTGEKLAQSYAAADLFVFPSKTDTFGLVLLEAAASGLRIAAYPVAGPADIFAAPESKSFAVLDENLQKAVDRALALPACPEVARRFAEKLSWKASARQFLQHLQPTQPHAIGE